MRLLFEDDLVEAVVHRCATGRRPGVPALQIRRFHAERERCYHVLDPDERANAFARMHLSWFAEWGLENQLSAPVAAFPELAPALAALAFRLARSRPDEGAELYCDAGGCRRGIAALRPERFVQEASLLRFLHHELAHLADMVNPAFGYVRDLRGGRQAASQERLTRERYRLLWDVSIDGRLTRRGLSTVADEAQRRREFERGFAFLPGEKRSGLFAALWAGDLACHDRLLELASDPRGLQGCHVPMPGASCPLCGFAAFDWSDAGRLRPEARARMQADFPKWQVEESVCARCAEMYESIVGLEYPATVCL